MPSTSQAGIITAAIGNIAINLALNIHRHAKARLVRMALDGIHVPSKSDYLRYLAVALLVLGQCTNFIAYGLAPASIISPLSVLAVISNCIVPPLLFDEAPSINHLTGTTIALPGILLLILSSPQDEDTFIYPLEPYSRLYLASLCVGVAVCSFIRSMNTRVQYLLRIECMLAAIMGTFCVLGIKCTALVLMDDDEEQYGTLPLFLFLIVTLSGFLQLRLIADIFCRYPIWQSVPHLFAFFTVFVGLGSAIIFHEFKGCTFTSKAEFVFGCILIISGVWLSAQPKAPGTAGIRVNRESALKGPKRRHRQKKNKNNKKQKLDNSTHVNHRRNSRGSHSRGSHKSRGSHGSSSWISIPDSNNSYNNFHPRDRRSSGSQRGRRYYSELPPNRRRYEQRYQYLSRSLDSYMIEPEFIVPSHTRPSSTPNAPASLESNEQTFLLIPRRQVSGYNAV